VSDWSCGVNNSRRIGESAKLTADLAEEEPSRFSELSVTRATSCVPGVKVDCDGNTTENPTAPLPTELVFNSRLAPLTDEPSAAPPKEKRVVLKLRLKPSEFSFPFATSVTGTVKLRPAMRLVGATRTTAGGKLTVKV